MARVTSSPPRDDPAAPAPEAAKLTPLLRDDPPRIGDFWLDARLTATASGVAFVAHDDAKTPALLVLLSEGAATDAAARDRLAGAVNKMDIDTVLARGGQGQDTGRLGGKFRAEADDPVVSSDGALGERPLAPWVALAYDGTTRASDEASRVLAEVDLSWLPAQGRASGPDYELYWIEQARPGVWRLWPLPWPGRNDRSGPLSILASWLLMLLLMCLAVLLAILLFQNAPEEQPPPPVPTSASGSGGSGSPSSAPPSSSSASPSSASPSSASASPSNGESPSESASPSNSPSSEPSSSNSAPPTGPGESTTQSRL